MEISKMGASKIKLVKKNSVFFAIGPFFTPHSIYLNIGF